MNKNEFNNICKKIKKRIVGILNTEIKSPIDMTDAFLFTGIGFITHGVMQIHRPSGFIVCGLLLFFIGIVGVFDLGSDKIKKNKG